MTRADTPQSTEARPARRSRPYETLIDVDVHPTQSHGIEILLPYMSAAWQEVLRALPPIAAPSLLTSPFPFGENSLAVDATPPDEGYPGSDPQFMVEDFFDRYDVGIAQLIMLEAFSPTRYCADPELAAAIISAYNDWMLDHWLIDPRMRHALLVTTTDPALAAAEIHRLGSDSRVCSVCIHPTPGRSLGDKHYFPVYTAAVEHGLPVVTHSVGKSINAPSGSYVEDRVNFALGASAQVTSLVFEGTFERYPELRVMILENGFSWVVPLMWRMDAGWRRNRFEVPWLKRWPSEYVRDHIRLSSQPLDDSPDATELYRQIELETTYLSEIVCYSSDYPHWDNDRPGSVLRTLRDDVKRKLFCENARTTLRT